MKISKRDRKVLVIGGVTAIVVLVVFYVALPFYENLSVIEDSLAQKRRMLGQSIRIIENEPVYRQQEVVLETELSELRAQLLNGSDAVLAQNQLETIVRGLADENGVTISRSTPLQERKVGTNYSKITVQLNLQGGVPEITNFLHAVSVHPRFLQVEEFSMNAFRVRDAVRLQPRVDVSGFIGLSGS
jgi:type II secretory pathway component PulM